MGSVLLVKRLIRSGRTVFKGVILNVLFPRASAQTFAFKRFGLRQLNDFFKWSIKMTLFLHVLINHRWMCLPGRLLRGVQHSASPQEQVQCSPVRLQLTFQLTFEVWWLIMCFSLLASRNVWTPLETQNTQSTLLGNSALRCRRWWLRWQIRVGTLRTKKPGIWTLRKE